MVGLKKTSTIIADYPTIQAKMNKPALTTRTLDFWLLGGASLLLWLIMSLLQYVRDHPAIHPHFTNTPYITSSLALLINYPHFIASYKLAYSRNTEFIRKHPIELILVPICLLLLVIAGYVAFDNKFQAETGSMSSTTCKLPVSTLAYSTPPHIGEILCWA